MVAHSSFDLAFGVGNFLSVYSRRLAQTPILEALINSPTQK